MEPCSTVTAYRETADRYSAINADGNDDSSGANIACEKAATAAYCGAALRLGPHKDPFTAAHLHKFGPYHRNHQLS
jgi:hypothetical protein